MTDNIEIMINDKAEEVIEEHQNWLETSTKVGDFIF